MSKVKDLYWDEIEALEPDPREPQYFPGEEKPNDTEEE